MHFRINYYQYSFLLNYFNPEFVTKTKHHGLKAKMRHGCQIEPSFLLSMLWLEDTPGVEPDCR